MELDQTRIEDAIVREVADKIIGEDELYSRVKKSVEDRIDRLFKTTADAQIRSAIEAAITQGFEREYQRVDSFGHCQGERTTIRAELEKMIGGYWNTKVDSQGKPATGYGADRTRAEWLMTQLVAKDFHGDMKQHVVNLGGVLKDKLRLELHETVNRLLTEVFHVRTPNDEAERRSDASIIHPKQGAPT
jgi:hypothetical protein